VSFDISALVDTQTVWKKKKLTICQANTPVYKGKEYIACFCVENYCPKNEQEKLVPAEGFTEADYVYQMPAHMKTKNTYKCGRYALKDQKQYCGFKVTLPSIKYITEGKMIKNKEPMNVPICRKCCGSQLSCILKSAYPGLLGQVQYICDCETYAEKMIETIDQNDKFLESYNLDNYKIHRANVFPESVRKPKEKTDKAATEKYMPY